ncbi:flagellar biosynthesis protein FlhB [Pyruvatibacter mobilis]|uniref:flagellar biosynthesis protein FlhB n=1 Tax=Pyruvatibacter mobilis TaxID=1712261 RepID=UPI003BAB3550
MSDQPDQSEKTEEASSKKLEEAHKKGDVAKSQEVSAWFGLIGITIIVVLLAGPMAGQLAAPLSRFIVQPHAFAVDGSTLLQIAQQLGLLVVAALALPMLVVIVAAIAGNLVQHKPVFTAENMKPKFSKISPLAGLKRIFGPQGMANFLKALAKLTIVSVIAFLVIWPERELLFALIRMELVAVPVVLQELALKLLGGVVAVMTIIAGLDFSFQKAQWLKKQRMTQKEVKDEYKQMEGDPAVKAKLRQIRAEKGRKRMMAQVPDATVVVTNPTHYSVALKYEDGMAAPVCVAKGVDQVAFKIREIAKEHDIPLVENVPLARALHATVEVDDEIPPEHYKAVAQVIGYVMRLKGKMRRSSARA